MPFVPSFSITPNSNPAAFTAQDTSTGSDGAITDRQLLLYTTAQSLYVPSIDFPLSAGSSITPAPITADVALNVVMNWLNSSGAAIYTYSVIFAFTQYAENFFYSLTQQQQANPAFLNDQQYFENKSKLRTLIDSANQAITVGKDVYSANTAISLYQLLLNNPTLYF
jgi:hypothetical protein